MRKCLIFIIPAFSFCSFSGNKSLPLQISKKTTVADTLPVNNKSEIKWDDINRLIAADSVLIAKSYSGKDFVISRTDYEVHAKQISKISEYDETFTKVEIEPQYPGGTNGLLYYLKNNLRYPREAFNAGVQGTVVVRCVVDQDGSLHDVQAVSGPVTGGLRDEAIRLVKESGKWHPAIQNLRLVKAYKRQAVTFRID